MSADLALSWNETALRWDVSITRGDFTVDPGLRSAVLVSLLTDRQAEPGDTLPANASRGGWWGDAYAQHLIGSRLWLLRRATLTLPTLRLLEDYAAEALGWMIDDGIAQSITAQATATGVTSATLLITIAQATGSNQFSVAWQTEGAR